MTKVYTKIANKLAVFDVETDDHVLAIETVKGEFSRDHKSPVLALVENSVKENEAA